MYATIVELLETVFSMLSVPRQALIRSVTTYACPIWEYAAGAHLLKLRRLQNRELRAIANLGRCTSARELHVAFKIPRV
jgi:hypothetical protein